VPWIVGTIVAMVAGCSDKPTNSPDRAAFLAAMEDLTRAQEAAMNSEDPDAWCALLDEDYIQLAPDTPPLIGKAAVCDWMISGLFGWPDIEAFTCRNREPEIFGDFGFFWGTHSYLMIVKGSWDTTRFEGKHLTIVKRQPDASWLFYADCFNSNAPPAN